ncbi:hypothetical protein ANANG_G00019280 [Anguilla anguilla]|uniref:Uncharacterized protein n=1 Tax=Anguilla anguilla TaxID=7936 RepID=A0A9D3MZ92_ANGAN|nr:hypothetical protein ANANG_G00019280 [Anguilla anguilla]
MPNFPNGLPPHSSGDSLPATCALNITSTAICRHSVSGTVTCTVYPAQSPVWRNIQHCHLRNTHLHIQKRSHKLTVWPRQR